MAYFYLTLGVLCAGVFIWAYYTFKKSGVNQERLSQLIDEKTQREKEIQLYENKIRQINQKFSKFEDDGPTGFFSASDASRLLSGNLKKEPSDSKAVGPKS